MALLGSVMAVLLVPQEGHSGPQGKTVDVLLGGLKSDDSTIREAAVSALAEVKPVQRRVLEALADVLPDSNEDVRSATRSALEALSAVEGFSLIAAGLNRPPRAVRLTRPQYPQAAFIDKIEGTVIVECLISRDGDVLRTRVIQSVPGLDDAALATVFTWLFAPALKDGRMVPTIAHAPVKFYIR